MIIFEFLKYSLYLIILFDLMHYMSSLADITTTIAADNSMVDLTVSALSYPSNGH